MMVLVGLLQIGAGAWSVYQGNVRLAIMNVCVGIANIAISKASG
jgi:hypothetical protein